MVLRTVNSGVYMRRAANQTIILGVFAGLLMLLSACSREGAGSQFQDDRPVTIRPPGTANEYLLAVGELEPTFGGFFFEGNMLKIYLLNADTAPQAEKDRVVQSLVRVYGSDLPELSHMTPMFLRGSYRMVDLYNWYTKLTTSLTLAGISFTDLDEARNRLAVGVNDATLKPAVQRVLTQLEIPVEAVIIEEESYACAAVAWFPVAAEIRDTKGRPAALGASVTLKKVGYEETAAGFGDPLKVYVGESVGGTFDVEVSKPFYDGAKVKNVTVPTDTCGYGETVTVEVTLALQKDAPPVRQVVVAPYGIGLGGGYSVQETAYVEADPGVSKAVSWRSEDERVATVSADGTITGVCRDVPGETFVTATSLADPSQKGSISVGVFAAQPGDDGCP